MEFSDQVKQLRRQMGLTQEQYALKINVTRQAVSNWENNLNLPDIETLIVISQVFHISLDELILGGTDMNKMTEKLIQDGSEGRRAKMNMVSTLTGAFLMILGLACFLIKANSVEYIDKQGILHENFYLLPIGFAFLFTGFLVLLTTTTCFLVRKLREK